MLISDIRDEIITEVGGDSTETALQTIVLGMIKSALRRFPRFTRNRILRTTKNGTLSAAGTTMAVPSGTLNFLKVYYVSSGKRIEITNPGLDAFTQIYDSSGSGSPQYYQVRGATMEFDRPADAAYTIYIETNGEISNVAASDTWAYAEEKAEIVKDGAKFYYYHDYQEDESKGRTHLDLFKAGLEEMESEYLREEIPDHVEEAD